MSKYVGLEDQEIFMYRFNRWALATSERSHEIPIRDIMSLPLRAYHALVKLCVYDFAQLCHPKIEFILYALPGCGKLTVKEIMEWRDELLALTFWTPEQVYARAREYDWSMDHIRWMWK